MTDRKRWIWVINDDSLFGWWCAAYMQRGGTMQEFVSRHREQVDQAIAARSAQIRRVLARAGEGGPNA